MIGEPGEVVGDSGAVDVPPPEVPHPFGNGPLQRLRHCRLALTNQNLAATNTLMKRVFSILARKFRIILQKFRQIKVISGWIFKIYSSMTLQRTLVDDFAAHSLLCELKIFETFLNN